MGKALYDGQLIDAYFTRSFYKHLLGAPLTYIDMEAVDPEYYKVRYSPQPGRYSSTLRAAALPAGRCCGVHGANAAWCPCTRTRAAAAAASSCTCCRCCCPIAAAAAALLLRLRPAPMPRSCHSATALHPTRRAQPPIETCSVLAVLAPRTAPHRNPTPTPHAHHHHPCRLSSGCLRMTSLTSWT